MVDLHLGGVFEDNAQRDFLVALVTARAHPLGFAVAFHEPRLTSGCRFDYLAQHLAEVARYYQGLVVGVDGKKLDPAEKARRLRAGAGKAGFDVEGISTPVLWAVACPSIEAWMLADPAAVRRALGRLYRMPLRHQEDPIPPKSEDRAKRELARWVEALLGAPLQRGGREHADAFGAELSREAIAVSRHPDLIHLLDDELPRFLGHCARAG